MEWPRPVLKTFGFIVCGFWFLVRGDPSMARRAEPGRISKPQTINHKPETALLRRSAPAANPPGGFPVPRPQFPDIGGSAARDALPGAVGAATQAGGANREPRTGNGDRPALAGWCALANDVEGGVQRQQVAVDAEPHDDPDGRVGELGVGP